LFLNLHGILARFTGQRGSDVVRLCEAFVDDGGFRLTQKKTKREIWCPIEDALAVDMATWHGQPGLRVPGPFVFQNQGKVDSRRLLDEQFADARAAIPELAGTTLPGLRGTRVVELRQRGATTMQIQDQVGMSLNMIERYCRFGDKKANRNAAVLSFAERHKNGKL
jgi:integrase